MIERATSAPAAAGVAPRLLVASYFGAGWTTGGAVIVDGLLARYSRDRFVRFSVPLRDAAPARGDDGTSVGALHVPGLFDPRWQALTSRALWHVGSRVQAAQAERAAARFGVERVWSIADYMWLPFMYRFMRRSSLPVHISVHDDPVSSARLIGWPDDMLRHLDHAMEFCYRHAASRDVISDGMRRQYQAAYDRDAAIVTHGITAPAIGASTRPLGRPIRIVHAGNLLYPEEALAFAHAIAGSGLASLTFIGNPRDSVREAAERLSIEIIPWVPQAELKERLREFDFGYLPYGFAEDRRTFVRTSFPTKLIAYAEAGLPIIHHGPSYSSVASFLESYHLGLLLDSSDPARIRSALTAVTPEAHAEMQVEVARAARDVFSSEVIFKRWKRALYGDGVSATPPSKVESHA